MVAGVDPWDMVDGITFDMGDNDSFADSFASNTTLNKQLYHKGNYSIPSDLTTNPISTKHNLDPDNISLSYSVDDTICANGINGDKPMVHENYSFDANGIGDNNNDTIDTNWSNCNEVSKQNGGKP